MEHYPIRYAQFRSYWETLDDLINNSQFYIPKEVLLQCRDGSSGIIKDWLEQRKDRIVYDNKDVYEELKNIERDNPSMSRSGLLILKNYQSEPFLIALAKLLKSNDDTTIIITEKAINPTIIGRYHIETKTLLEFLQSLGVLNEN